MTAMQKFLDMGYWFESAPGDLDLRFWRIMLIGAGVLMLTGISASLMAWRYRDDGVRRRMQSKIAAWAFTIAPLVVMLWFFRVQHAYVLSMRFLVLVLAFTAAVWAFFIVRFALIVFPRRLKEREAQDS